MNKYIVWLLCFVNDTVTHLCFALLLVGIVLTALKYFGIMEEEAYFLQALLFVGFLGLIINGIMIAHFLRTAVRVTGFIGKPRTKYQGLKDFDIEYEIDGKTYRKRRSFLRGDNINEGDWILLMVHPRRHKEFRVLVIEGDKIPFEGLF